MAGTIELIQRIRYAEIPDEKGEMQVYAIPEGEDVQELVRCKDCKHLGYTNSHRFCKWLNRCVDEDWFCADGKRRTDDA